jgi:DHA2 family multidrug resistance protein
MGKLAGIVQLEANVLAYIDAFWLTFGFAVAALLVTALITRAPPDPSPTVQNRDKVSLCAGSAQFPIKD